MWRKWRTKRWSNGSGSRARVAALAMLVIAILAGCTSPESALQTAEDNATATAASSGPPVLRIATVGIGPTAAVSAASAAATPRAVGSVVMGIAASGTAKMPSASASVSVINGALSTTQVANASSSPSSPGTASPSAPRGTPEPGLLLDPKGRYSFRIPMPWKAEMPMAGGVDLEVVCDAPNGLMRTTSVDTPAAVTLDNATLIITEALKKNTLNYEPVPSGSLNAMIGGQPARRIEYYGIYSGTRLHYVSYVIVYNQKSVVTLLFVAQPDNFDRLLMQGSVVLTSFAFIQPDQAG